MDILAIAALCIVTAIIAKTIQPTNQDIAIVITIAGVAAVAFSIIGTISDVLYEVQNLAGISDISGSYISIVFRVLGICYVCEISSSCCRDCGESSLASIIDIAGRVAVSVICLPLIKTFIQTVESILELG
ncbi:MAG: stage III sporulation AC/AD family protein [Oscillospiraceae bacterium]|nr:stage III sporulation AC/AD family protein [Oscillospiraceae bacterium]